MMRGHIIRELRVAGILDEPSCFCFPYECRFKELSALNWQKELESFKPELVFIESAWHGRKNSWSRQIDQCSANYRGVIQWCNEHAVPTVFWNKDDPLHFDTFLAAAGLCDYVYTTDLDCVPLYKRLLKKDTVGVLPFAVNPKICNPIQTYKRKDGCCFAGAYDAFRAEWYEDFERIFDLCAPHMRFDLYDQKANPGDANEAFPEKYRQHIVGSLPMDKADIVYKGYRWSLTMNTVKRSSTMEARQVFELLACNTLCLSNPCSGIKNMLGDLVVMDDNAEEFSLRLQELIKNPQRANKLRLSALRRVLQEHTYRRRMQTIVSDVLGWGRTPEDEPSVCVYSVVANANELEQVLRSFARQEWKAALQVIITDVEPAEPLPPSVQLVKPQNEMTPGDLGEADYYAYFSPRNYYGRNYLTDVMLSTRYATASVIGKASYYRAHSDTTELLYPDCTYKWVLTMDADKCAVQRHIARKVSVFRIAEGYAFRGFAALAIDPYNFCAEYQENMCEAVEDIPIDCGYTIARLERIARGISNEKHFLIQWHQAGEALLKAVSYKPDRYLVRSFGHGIACIYSTALDERPTCISLTEAMSSETYKHNGGIRVFLDGYGLWADGSMVFMDKEGKTIGSTLLPFGGNACCSVPEKAVAFQLKLVLKKHGYVLLQEAIINVEPERVLPAERRMEDAHEG